MAILHPALQREFQFDNTMVEFAKRILFLMSDDSHHNTETLDVGF
jgi:hypothetical protein